MSITSSLERRGAIYYWRRRLPIGMAARLGLKQMKISLKTRHCRPARYLAAQLDATAEDVFMSDSIGITKQELTALFRAVFEQHSEKLATIAAFSREERGFDAAIDVSDETVMGWAYRIRSTNGVGATPSSQQLAEMAQAGLPPSAIGGVDALLSQWRENGRGSPSADRLRRHLEALDVSPSAGNMAKATPVYLRALGEALLQTKTRYQADPLPFEDLVAEVLAPPPLPPPAAAVDLVPAEDVQSPKVVEETERPKRRHEKRNVAQGKLVAVGGSVRTIGEKLVEQNTRDKIWEIKTARQAAATFDLLDRYLREHHELHDLRDLRQHQLDGFAELLRQLSPTYGKSPKDRTRSMTDLRGLGAKLPDDVRGLAAGTRNRHLTFVGQLLRRARSAGIKLDADLSASGLRAKKQRRGRDERVVPADSSVVAFFCAPVFTGCAGWDRLHEPGEDVFHRAAYFGPMLAYYHGMRREEFCGLAVNDVISVYQDLPYVHVGPNAIRRVKNLQSVRNLALHPELLRLRFLEYVAMIKSLGYERLFPDLYSASTNSPVGDRYYDELQPIIKQQNLTPHQMRHYFGNTLKQRGVQAEHRADLLGHGGGDETTERYCEAIDLEVQLKLLAHIPLVTENLLPYPVNVVPWVAKREAAPWSRRQGQ